MLFNPSTFMIERLSNYLLLAITRSLNWPTPT